MNNELETIMENLENHIIISNDRTEAHFSHELYDVQILCDEDYADQYDDEAAEDEMITVYRLDDEEQTETFVTFDEALDEMRVWIMNHLEFHRTHGADVDAVYAAQSETYFVLSDLKPEVRSPHYHTTIWFLTTSMADAINYATRLIQHAWRGDIDDNSVRICTQSVALSEVGYNEGDDWRLYADCEWYHPETSSRHEHAGALAKWQATQ